MLSSQQVTIEIEGGGTIAEVRKALLLIAEGLIDQPHQDLDGAEWNDCSLRTHINLA